jgi:hypothetical protein
MNRRKKWVHTRGLTSPVGKMKTQRGKTLFGAAVSQIPVRFSEAM